MKQFFGKAGALSKSLSGYEPRQQQIDAANAIQSAMESGDGLTIIEAGTGVGKTLAYLVPALLHASPERKVIISTHTLALQSQLWDRDLPLAASLQKKPIKSALLKGRGNYLCLQEMNASRHDVLIASQPEFHEILDWSEETETGDLVELPFTFMQWNEVAAHPDTCKGGDCLYYQDCFYYKSKRLAEEASIILVNHALFFADLAVRHLDPEVRLLPEYAFAVFDEAHHLENTAARVFGISVTSRRVPLLVAKIKRSTRSVDIDEQLLRLLELASQDLFRPFMERARPEFFVSDILSDLKGARDIVADMAAHLEALAGQLRKADSGANQAVRDRLDGLQRQIVRLREELLALFHQDDSNYMRWGNIGRTGSNQTMVTLSWSPISVAPVLAEMLWSPQERPGAALISATLSTNGGFDFLRQRLGIDYAARLPGNPHAENQGESPVSESSADGTHERTQQRFPHELVLGSPFDYPNQCLLYLPRHLPAPNDSLNYIIAVADEMKKLIHASNGGAFLLFTSHRMLRLVYDTLADVNLPYRLYRQGDMPPGRLVTAFRETPNSVLLGTQSFWEGVDVPGDALRLVIVDRLPFGSPDSPQHRARVDAVTAAGGDWFRDFALPQAQLKLKQGFGRLIRTATDRGVVAILDTRLMTKTYGHQFLKYLPPARQTSSMEDVNGFYPAGALNNVSFCSSLPQE